MGWRKTDKKNKLNKCEQLKKEKARSVKVFSLLNPNGNEGMKGRGEGGERERAWIQEMRSDERQSGREMERRQTFWRQGFIYQPR